MQVRNGQTPNRANESDSKQKGHQWRCTGYADTQEEAEHHQPRTLRERVEQYPPKSRWSIAEYQVMGDGEHIAPAIMQGIAVAVSDGFFKEGFATSAWIIQGRDVTSQVQGQNVVPGTPEGQHAYRGELSGLYVLVCIVEYICKHHGVQEESITVGCDREEALHKAMN